MKTTADFFGVSPEYLMTGHEAPVRKTTTREEDELPELFRCLPVEKQQRYLGRLENEAEQYAREKKYLDEKEKLSV